MSRLTDYAILRTADGFALLLLRGPEPTVRLELSGEQAARLVSSLASSLADELARDPLPPPPRRPFDAVPGAPPDSPWG